MAAVNLSCLCWVLTFVVVIDSAVADQKNITAEIGQNVLLICRAPNNDKETIIAVEWSRADLGDEEYVLMYRDGHFDLYNQHPSFKNRVDLQDRQMKDGDVSLILKNVTTADNGTYECRVFINETRSWKSIRKISLLVVPPGPHVLEAVVVAVLLIFGVIFIIVGLASKHRQKKTSHPPPAPETEQLV